MGEADDDGAFFYEILTEGPGKVHPTPGYELQPMPPARAALLAVTEATVANQALFTAMRERQARRKEALEAGATLAEIQEAITAGQPAEWRPR